MKRNKRSALEGVKSKAKQKKEKNGGSERANGKVAAAAGVDSSIGSVGVIALALPVSRKLAPHTRAS